MGLLIPPPLQAQEMTLKERLQTVRSARTIFYELDDYYREIKRNFSKKSKNEIMDIRKKIGILDDKLRNLPPKNHSGDIEFYCRDAPSALFFFISILSGNYGSSATIVEFTEQRKKDLRRNAEEDFIIPTSRCLTLFDEIEAKLLAQMKKP